MRKHRELYTIGTHQIEIRDSSTGSMSPWHREAYEKAGITNFMVTCDMATFIKIDDNIYRIDKNRQLINTFMEQMESLYDEKPGIAEEYLIFLKNNAIEEFTLYKITSVEDSLNKILNKR